MPGRSLRVARIAGIPVGISIWWLAVVALLTLSLATGYFPQRVPGVGPAGLAALALGSVLTVFAGILAHEFAHALVARRAGVEIEEIDLWLLGGVARMRSLPARAADELRFALAGPAVTVALALLFTAALIALPASAPAALRALVGYQAQVNAMIAAFNLLPALPLDGGRAARAVMWRRSGDLVGATSRAARLGRAMGWMLVWLGVFATFAGFIGGLWFAVIGLFVVSAAAAEEQRVRLEATLAGMSAADVMTPGAAPVEPTLPRIGAAEPAASLLERTDFLAAGRAVVVDELGRPVGAITLSELGRLARPGPARRGRTAGIP